MRFTNSDLYGDTKDKKSTSRYLFKFGSTTFSQNSKKQSIFALSSCEAEYVVAFVGTCQTAQLENLLKQTYEVVKGPMNLEINNMSTISHAKHPIAHDRSKHKEIQFHFLRDQVNRAKLELVYCKTEEQATDILTKPLKKERFEKLRNMLRM